MYGYAYISRQAVERVADTLKGMQIKPDNFLNKEFYPPPHDDPELIARYFLVMVAMDHRLSRPGRKYEAIIDRKHYHGADLLYRLGIEKYNEDPEFFSPKRLMRISVNDIRSWLTVDNARPPDPRIRAFLLKDLGYKIQEIYNGKVLLLIKKSKNRLKSRGFTGFIDRLKVFWAYNDPVEKKSHLLAKFLERRGLLKIVDPNNKEVPVDNHVSRLALRWGIIRVEDEWLVKISKKKRFAYEEDIIIRFLARKAFKQVAETAGKDPYMLDDFLWFFGRKCCSREAPICLYGCTLECRAQNVCINKGCVFKDLCSKYGRLLPEHTYYNTWYY